MTFNLAAEIAKETDAYRAARGMPMLTARLVAVEYEHLLAKNHSWWCAHGCEWRQEKLAHEADRDVGRIEE